MEQIDYNILFRWFVGLSMDDTIWDASTFSKNRARLFEADVAQAFAGLRKLKLRGLQKVRGLFTFTMAAYNLIRIPKLVTASALAGATQ